MSTPPVTGLLPVSPCNRLEWRKKINFHLCLLSITLVHDTVYGQIWCPIEKLIINTSLLPTLIIVWTTVLNFKHRCPKRPYTFGEQLWALVTCFSTVPYFFFCFSPYKLKQWYIANVSDGHSFTVSNFLPMNFINVAVHLGFSRTWLYPITLPAVSYQ